MSDDDLDPVLAAAFAAERRATAAVVAAAGISRDRLLVAVLAKTAHRPAAPATPPRRRRWAIVAAACAGLSLAYAAGRITAPATTTPAVPPVRVADGGVRPDAPADAPSDGPIDAVALDAAAPAHAAAPRPPGPDNGEALLLDQARAALRRHLPADALAALERHQRAFPNGQLREDRDVLLIEVALAQDRRADANESIAAYFEHYPHGSLRTRVEALQRELDRMIRR